MPGATLTVALGMADWTRDEADAPRWIGAMVAAPGLIQRPILLLDDGSAMSGATRRPWPRPYAAVDPRKV
jgi:arsenate reductase (glutaredoxin)